MFIMSRKTSQKALTNSLNCKMSLTTNDLKTVYSKTYEARHKWSNLLLALDVSFGTIQSIRKKHQDNPDDCYQTGLNEWLASGDSTWKNMTEALSGPTVGHNDIARQIENEYLQPEESSINPGSAAAGKEGETEVLSSEQKVSDNLVILINEQIGFGARGAVYKGKFRGKPCAVKMLHHFLLQMQARLPVTPGLESANKSFERECEHLQSFQHENVVQHISTERHPLSQNILLVTELMDCNLRSYLSGSEKNSLTYLREISLCKNVASGLAYIHSRHIIHRDLCGDNVLIKLCQPVPIAKISDFGMSKLFDPSKHSSSFTLTALVNRTGYLPPEAQLGDYNKSLDIFSFGVIMMQIVCKLETVQSATDRSTHIAKIPSTHRLKPVIKSCLEDDPEKRPVSGYIDTNLAELEALALDESEQIPQHVEITDLESQIINEEPHAKAPKEGILLNCFAEYDSYPLSDQMCWAVASFNAPYHKPNLRVPVDIVAVIDKSGSMAGAKLMFVKEALNYMIDQLEASDRLSVVTYDTNVRVNFELMQMNETNKSRAKSLIATIKEGSATNLCGGLLKGLELISKNHQANPVQSVILFTDGMVNEGITNTHEILAEVDKYQKWSEYTESERTFPPSIKEHTFNPPPVFPVRRAMNQVSTQQVPLVPTQPTTSFGSLTTPPPGPPPSEPPPLPPRTYFSRITSTQGPLPSRSKYSQQTRANSKFKGTIYTFGFGSNHNAALLEAISTKGGGLYSYIDSKEKMSDFFANCLGGLLSVVGQDLSLKLELQGSNSVSEVHANRGIEWIIPKKSCEIGMGDLQSEEKRDIVLELNLPAMSSPQHDIVLKITLSYLNVITSTYETTTFDLSINRKNGDQGQPNESVDIQRNRIIMTRALKEAAPLVSQKKSAEAQGVLQRARFVVKKSPTNYHPFTRHLVEELCEGESSINYMHPQQGQNLLRSKAQTHAVQRSNQPCSPMYDTSPRQNISPQIRGRKN